jgi:hypothetical protein
MGSFGEKEGLFILHVLFHSTCTASTPRLATLQVCAMEREKVKKIVR